MGPIAVYDESVRTKIENWLAASTELFVELFQPHSGAGGDWYLISSYASFTEMIARAPSGAVFFILREQQFPIRGIIDDAFIKRAVKEMQDGEWYTVTQREFFPEPLSRYGSGNSIAELQADLEDCRGMLVCLGKDPVLPVEYWIENDLEDVIVATKP